MNAPNVTRSARRSQGSWNTGSSASTSTGPNPCIPPRSYTPSTVDIGSHSPMEQPVVRRHTMSTESGQGARATSEDVEPPRSHGNDVDRARLETESLLRQTEAELRFRVGLEELVTSMSTRLLGVHLEELPSVVEHGLGELCEYFGVDRAYALKVDQDFVFDLNVEWWAPDVPQRTTPVLELPIEAQRFWFRVLRSGSVVHFPDVDDAGEAAAGAVEALRHDGVRSILFLPLLARGTTVGFVGLEARRSTCSWSAESIALMRTVGELFVSAVERSRAEEALA